MDNLSSYQVTAREKITRVYLPDGPPVDIVTGLLVYIHLEYYGLITIPRVGEYTTFEIVDDVKFTGEVIETTVSKCCSFFDPSEESKLTIDVKSRSR